jgi:hypothetical protein
MEQKRIIKISQNKIFITPDYYFILEETNLPQTYFSFKGTQDFFWEIEITGYDKTAKKLTAKVIDYAPLDIVGFYEQSMKTHVDLLCFEKFEWDKLEPFLSLRRKADLKHLLVE